MVGRKDRDGWVSLFHADDGFVEDPVNAGRYQGRSSIETFWDVFIGPQPSVGFDVRRDFWTEGTLIRQCTVVSVTQADPDRTLDVPALIRYTTRGEGLASLQAVWEPRHVITWFLGLGLRGLWALTRHGVRMVGRAGLRNALSFGGTLVGSLSRRRATALVEGLCDGGPEGRSALRHARVTVGGPEGALIFEEQPEAALAELVGLTGSLDTFEVNQLLVCGRTVAAFLEDDDGEGALALMFHTKGADRIEELTAVWSPHPRVLGLDGR